MTVTFPDCARSRVAVDKAKIARRHEKSLRDIDHLMFMGFEHGRGDGRCYAAIRVPAPKSKCWRVTGKELHCALGEFLHGGTRLGPPRSGDGWLWHPGQGCRVV